MMAEQKINLWERQAMLVMVQNGAVTHFSPNMGLPHVEFVRRMTGERPEGAWVGTVSKIDGKIMGVTSKHFYGYQLPAPEDVDRALLDKFE